MRTGRHRNPRNTPAACNHGADATRCDALLGRTKGGMSTNGLVMEVFSRRRVRTSNLIMTENTLGARVGGRLVRPILCRIVSTRLRNVNELRWGHSFN